MEDELMRVYNRLYQSGRYRNNRECYEAVVKQSAPRFYVDARRAFQYLSPMSRGDMKAVERLGELKQAMYRELFAVVMRLSSEERYHDRSLYGLVRLAVMEPAPRFYISADRMAQIWRKRKREVRGFRNIDITR